MSRERKFYKGPRIWSVMDLAMMLEQGRYIYWRNKPLHVGWWSSMPMRTLLFAVRSGHIFRAIPTDPKVEVYRGNQ